LPPVYNIRDPVVQQNLIRISRLQNEKRALMTLRVQTFDLLKHIEEELEQKKKAITDQ